MFENAYAQAAPGGGDIFASMLPIILIFAIFYFLMVRPQNKRRKEHENKVNAITRGDEVVISGGIYGTVKAVEEKTIEVEISRGVSVKQVKHMVLEVTKKEAVVQEKKAQKKAQKKTPSKTTKKSKK